MIQYISDLLPDKEDSGTQSSCDWDDVFCVVFLFLWGISRLNVLLIDSSWLNWLQKLEEEVALLDVWVLEGCDMGFLGNSAVSPFQDFIVGKFSKSLGNKGF